jgi:hypothetical protein
MAQERIGSVALSARRQQVAIAGYCRVHSLAAAFAGAFADDLAKEFAKEFAED